MVESVCLSVAATLGAYMDRLCIVGGLVPSLLIDRVVGPDPETGTLHPGTNDLDVGLEVALLDDGEYTEISRRLRQEDFGPDKNENGNPTPQRWKLGDFAVTVDFLLPPTPGGMAEGRVQPLQGDFAALVTPGLELAREEREEVVLDGHTLKGEEIQRTIPVCGPAVFVVLKALAFADRGEPKDAFDLIYVLGRWPAGIANIAERLAQRALSAPVAVDDALEKLARDFATPNTVGPRRVAEFEGGGESEHEAISADAHGYVADLLGACGKR